MAPFTCALLFGFFAALHAQSIGTVQGRVLDPEGAVVAGARITLRNRATGLERIVETGGEGIYVAAALPVGAYRVEAYATGFQIQVVESLVIGQQWDNDERVVLFVRLREGVDLTPELKARIRDRIRANTTPRHVPARIVRVTEIPRTKSGKIVELAVRDVVHGRDVRNREALANPEALDEFRDRPELQD